jgi:predicted HAD superfamily Cof-like phosphohydrolase
MYMKDGMNPGSQVPPSKGIYEVFRDSTDKEPQMAFFDGNCYSFFGTRTLLAPKGVFGWRGPLQVWGLVGDGKSSKNPGPNVLSSVAMSNLFTMGCSAKTDPRQAVPETPYTMPVLATRILRSRLCVEEVVSELCKALGVGIALNTTESDGSEMGVTVRFEDLEFDACGEPDMEEAIDACIDGIYVLVGTLCSMGVCDVPHMNIVNYANNAKFPNGEPIINPETGKFQKPPGWKAPEHLKTTVRMANLKAISDELVNNAKKTPNFEEFAPVVKDGKRVGAMYVNPSAKADIEEYFEKHGTPVKE